MGCHKFKPRAPRVCACGQCGIVFIGHPHRTYAEDCPVRRAEIAARKSETHQKRRAKRNAAVAAAQRVCEYPGCSETLGCRGRTARWCLEHSAAVSTHQSARKVAYGGGARSPHRSTKNRIQRDEAYLKEEPREPNILCKHCFGLPWARRPDRLNDGLTGKHGIENMRPVAGEDGLCVGCGLPYAPEPEPEAGPVLSSGAAMAFAV